MSYLLPRLAFNSSAPGRWGSKFNSAVSKHMLRIKFVSISCEITVVRMPRYTFDDTNHYLIQCWPRSMSPYVVTRPQWVQLFRCLVWIVNVLLTWASHFTHWDRDKMADNVQTTISNPFSWMFYSLIQITFCLFRWDQLAALVNVNTLYHSGNHLWHGTVMTEPTDACTCHQTVINRL